MPGAGQLGFPPFEPEWRLDDGIGTAGGRPVGGVYSVWRRREERIIINDHRLVSAVFAALYQRHRWNEIPQALKAVHERNAEGLSALIEPFINLALDEDFSSLAFMAVDDQDHVLGTEADYEAQLGAYPRFHPYLAPLWHSQSCQWLGSAKEPLTLPFHSRLRALRPRQPFCIFGRSHRELAA